MHPARKHTRRSVTLVAVGLASSLTVALGPSMSVRAADGSITGTVFRDYNSDGDRDIALKLGVAVDGGIGGIQVRAIDADGTIVGTATTEAGGTYTLTVTGADTADVRVEFEIPTNVPSLADLEPSFAAMTGATNSTRGGLVQFAVIGDSGVNLALNVPGDYCADNPQLVTCAAHLGTGTASSVGAFTMPSNMNGFLDYTATTSKIGSSADLGAIFGIGVDRQRNVFLGTYVKRHVEYGSAGPTNTIYRINLDQPGTVTPFVTLPGSLPTHSATPAIAGVDYSGDTEVFDDVGRIGLGDVDVTPDGSTLLAVDMDETAPKLYFVPILGSGDSVTPGTPRSIPIPSPTSIPKPAAFNNISCAGQWHPMGIGLRGSRILVGGVCGAENTVTPSAPVGPDPTLVSAWVLEYTGDLSGNGSFSTIWAERLSYERGCVYTDGGIPCLNNTSEVGTPASADWSAWTETPRFFNRSGQTSYIVSGAQPMLANIEILDGGGLLVGFRDRLWDQQMNGMAAYSQDVTVSVWTHPDSRILPFGTPAGGMAGGDLLRVCATSSGLVTEANGTCPAGDLLGAQYLDPSGSQEYFFDSFIVNGGEIHPEIFTGSLTALPGFPGGWTTAYDVTGLSRQGVYAFGANAAALNGARGPVTGYGSHIGGLDFGNLNGFNKGIGLADIEVMCNFAPVQIGDRLWFDIDGDGIQDAGESPVVGATVNLRDSSGTIIDTATTDANGEYRFSSTTDPLVVGQSFSITIDDPDDFAPGGILAGWAPSKLGTGTDIDSDGDIVGGYPRISVPTVSAGFNDHSFDIGFATKVSVGGLVWNDLDGDGLQDPGETPLSGVRLDLSLPNGDPATDRLGRVVTSVVTGPDGTYSFDFLPPGTYRVTATSPSGMIATLGLVDTSDPLVAPGSTDPNLNFAFRPAPVILPVVSVSVGDRVWNDLDGDGAQDPDEPGIVGVRLTIRNTDGSPVVDVNGNPVTTTTTGANGNYIFTNLPPGQYVVTVAGPAGFVASNSAALSGSAVSESLTSTNASDLTLDFGYTALRHSIAGNVWLDTDRSTTRSGSERNIVGVEVRLLDRDGSPALDVFGRPVAPVFTDAGGNYVFGNLAPGDYVVALTPPWGLTPTNLGAGANSGQIRLDVVLTEGASVTGLDVGLAPTPTLPVTGSSDQPFVIALWVLVFGILISARRRQPS